MENLAEHIRVKTPEGAYDIVIQAGLLKQLGERAAEFGLDGLTVVTTDHNVDPLYGHELKLWLPNAWLALMPAGEATKTLDTVQSIYDQWFQIGADRYTTMIALGGGVVGDTVGFAASTYMRGVPLVQIPTTLLAMVDSSVGGKVGVDLPQGKNLVGAFKQPRLVLIDPDTLRTLPAEEWRAGMAEVIKHGLIADPELLNPELHTLDRATELVQRAVQVKVDIVQQDPYEENIRAYLNLGHTFGHAIELVSGYSWRHGEAVGVGLLAAALLSYELGLCGMDVPNRVETMLAGLRLPRSTGGMDAEALYESMQSDKKRKGGKLRFILLKGIGQPVIVADVAKEKVLGVLREIS